MTLYSTVVGLIPHFLLLNQKRVKSAYFLYHGIGSLLLLVPGVLLVPERVKLTLLFSSVSVCAYLLTEKKETLSRALMSLALLIGLYAMSPSSLFEWFFFCITALMLGTSLGIMCVGHWYLNQPKLPIGEFKKVVSLFVAILFVRDLTAVFFVSHLVWSRGGNWLMSSTPGLFLLMRVMWGLVAPTFLSYFVWETVKISSTQSATGLLYVNLVMVLIGEIVSLYLFQFHGVRS